MVFRHFLPVWSDIRQSRTVRICGWFWRSSVLRTVPTSVPRHCADTACMYDKLCQELYQKRCTVPRIVPRTVYCAKNCAKKCVHTVPTTVPTTTMLTVLRMVPRCWHSPTKRVTLVHFSTRKHRGKTDINIRVFFNHSVRISGSN